MKYELDVKINSRGEVELRQNDCLIIIHPDDIVEVSVLMSGKKPKIDSKGFDEFWAIYPRKHQKKLAQAAWSKIKLTDELFEKILEAVRQECLSEQWQRDGGKWIPLPSTWLNQERWGNCMTLDMQVKKIENRW